MPMPTIEDTSRGRNSTEWRSSSSSTAQHASTHSLFRSLPKLIHMVLWPRGIIPFGTSFCVYGAELIGEPMHQSSHGVRVYMKQITARPHQDFLFSELLVVPREAVCRQPRLFRSANKARRQCTAC
ncbi:hypothetical protein VOLCADRAFT_98907 [Volvox carteri f. nagariensis]|uniref:Uncharacterized protein n=1 Tax=Volvox carteri f. nagariensis TaxID=3068 RepID=D8UGK5_VOLCA|nr:uncharacterized protein VOLCADRAFT_98907 [Volvox carteri f. nagariensis]EFJ41114.1 hypothetical protein VOLCADRAFT_98907 [Volvox carteri f. nagariensis]|eukprot:XP_002957786.1 hypothetical protein VOLCADRAFT_98907 [Volvox carteri f. nagariensis]